MDAAVQLPTDDSFDMLRRNVAKLAATGRSVKCVYVDVRDFDDSKAVSAPDGLYLSGKLEVIIDTRQYLVELINRRAADVEQVLVQMFMLAGATSTLATVRADWLVSDMCFPCKISIAGELVELCLRVLVTPAKITRANSVGHFLGAKILAFGADDNKHLQRLRRQLASA